MVAAYYAFLWSLPEPDRVAARADHLAWFKGVQAACNVEGARQPQPGASACVTKQYRDRAAFYKRSLGGDAAAEANLAPTDLFAIQRALLERGLAQKEPDGIFNASTRQAISAFRQFRGRPPADFLSAQDRDELIRGKPQAASQDYYRPERPPPDYRTRPDRPVDPRQVIPEMLQGILGGGGWPPRMPPNRRQEQADYRRDGYQQPDSRNDQPRPYRPGRSQADEDENEAPSNMTEFAPSNKLVQSGPRPFASPPEKAAAPPSEFSDSGSSVVTNPLGGKSQAADNSTKTVEVVGSGETADAARKDAARLAVQQVAGVFIDNRRRIELNMTDNKVSEVVNEKLISYTNAYVSKFDVQKTEQKSGFYEVTAKVAVSVAPLLKTLQANEIPTVPFDTATAAATTQTMAQEKLSASEMYLDLLSRVSSLVNVGVGQPRVDTALPSGAEEAWLRIPLTFSVNDEAMKEWSAKFKLIAQNQAAMDFNVIHPRPRGEPGSECSIPQLSSDLFSNRGWRESFLSKSGSGSSYNIAACFSSYQTPTGVAAECFGRSFVTGQERSWHQSCKPGEKCYYFDVAANQIYVVLDFVDKEKSVIYGTKAHISKFPMLSRETSSPRSREGQKEFINHCAGPPNLFFTLMNKTSMLRADYGDVVFFPTRGAKAYAYYNILIPNNVISSITEVRARIEKRSTGGDREASHDE